MIFLFCFLFYAFYVVLFCQNLCSLKTSNILQIEKKKFTLNKRIRFFLQNDFNLKFPPDIRMLFFLGFFFRQYPKYIFAFPFFCETLNSVDFAGHSNVGAFLLSFVGKIAK